MEDIQIADGNATLFPEDSVEVGSLGCWTLAFTVGEDGLPPGAAIRVSIPHGFTPVQTENSAAPGYLKAVVGNPDVLVSLAVEPVPGGGYGSAVGSSVLVFVEKAPLEEGDCVTLTYGAGSGRAYSSSFSGLGIFQISICTDIFPERFFPIGNSPGLEITAGDLYSLEVTAQSKENFESIVTLRIVGRDFLGNRCVGWSGWLKVESETKGVRIPASQRCEDLTGEGVVLEVSLSEKVKGSVRFRVRETETNIEGTSNPILVGGIIPYWGDLHACIPQGSDAHPELDFELAVGPTPTLEKGSFHFQTGVESSEEDGGDSSQGLLRFSLPDVQSDDMLSSHLLEIYSCWGNREDWGSCRPDIRLDRHPDRTVHAVLGQGIISGFAAGTNSRFGVAGDARRAELGRGYSGGLTAVYSTSIARESLFEALRSRRCYATTGARILLWFEIDGYEMGRRIEVDSEDQDLLTERNITVQICGTSLVDRIEIIRNNLEVCTYRGDSEDLSFQWTDRQELPRISLRRPLRGGGLTCYYYIRVTQRDSEIAWSSPIWFVLRNLKRGREIG